MARRRLTRGGVAGTAILLVAGLSAAAVHAQSSPARDVAATASWLHQYYADYEAMSAAPTGPAMEKWLSHYAPYAFFEDPTIGLSGMGHDQIRKPYVEAFTGPLGPVRWTVLRQVTDGEWTAVEGYVRGSQKGVPVHTRFSTWFKIRGAHIVHQIDYLDYESMRRQAAGQEPAPTAGLEVSSPIVPDERDAERALALSGEFYRRYDAMPIAKGAGIERFVELMAEDFTMEDPTSRLRYDSRASMRRALYDALATGAYGPLHWQTERTLTDGEWVAHEGTFRGVFNGRPFATRFTTWLRVRGNSIVQQIDYVDYVTFRRLVSQPGTP